MNRYPSIAALIAMALGTAALALPTFTFAEEHDEEEEVEFEVAELYLELNDTDGDLGFHGLIDGDEWKRLRIINPEGRPLMNAWLRGALRDQGLTEFFFESAEPTFDELDPAEFLARFPEGAYEIEGVTVDGEEIEGESELSHTLAGPAPNLRVNGIAAADGCDIPLAGVVAPVTISWDPVTMSHPDLGNTGIPVTVRQYELVAEIERGDDDVPDVLVFKVDMLPNNGGGLSFTLPADFVGDYEEFKFEVVTKLDNGNQTATESCFELAD